MRDIEHPPLHPAGIKDIREDELYPVFVQPFGQGKAHDHRENLLIKFGNFLEQFKRLGMKAELWIDGSFATHALDPDDVDVVFYFDPEQVDALEGDKRDLFERLFHSRRFMKAQYRVEVFFGLIGNEPDYEQWRQTFGTCYDNITPKGLFRLYFN